MEVVSANTASNNETGRGLAKNIAVPPQAVSLRAPHRWTRARPLPDHVVDAALLRAKAACPGRGCRRTRARTRRPRPPRLASAAWAPSSAAVGRAPARHGTTEGAERRAGSTRAPA